ncbi:MAG: response regulator [Desulfobacterium sp.]|nr:response regulator [Desulfobacterium sp.]
MLKKFFEKKEYVVHVAENSDNALKLFAEHNIQVMFLDLNLGEETGLDLCRQIRKDRPLAVIHAITGYASLFELADCRDAGFDDYFLKPVDTATLLKATNDAFEKIERWKQRK